MRQEPQRVERKGLSSTGSDLDRKFWMAMALFAILAALAWFTVGPEKVLIRGYSDEYSFFGHSFALNIPGHWVEIRLLPLIIIGGFALRAVLARHAEKIRRGGNGGGSTTPKNL